MVGTSINTHNFTLKPSSTTIKFLCSYGGKILPRYPDGKLRYNGGDTRVLAVEHSISFAELLVKLEELCGTSMVLRCQLPDEDLDALISITSDEDLVNLIEEYDRFNVANSPATIKIRAFLFAPRSAKKVSPASSTASSSSNDATSPKSMYSFTTAASISSSSRSTTTHTTTERSSRYMSRPRVSPLGYEKAAGKPPQCSCHGQENPSRHVYLVNNGNHWQ